MLKLAVRTFILDEAFAVSFVITTTDDAVAITAAADTITTYTYLLTTSGQ